MAKHTFVAWLNKEVASSSCALLRLYEELDKLKYIEGPRLENEYMDKIGRFEEKVIEEEIECELLQEKLAMIQSAINRREPIDEAAIDKEISKLRTAMLKEAIGDEPPKDFADITEEQAIELQVIYSEIVKNYHPQTHHDLTDAHKALFKKAQEAYRRKDLDALRLIYDMLKNSDGEEMSFEFNMELNSVEIEETADERFATDYTLVADLYKNFIPTPEEAAIKEECDKYKQNIEQVMKDIDMLKTTFPYSTKETIEDPDKLAKYKGELEIRLYNATKERERISGEIEKTKEGITYHE